MDQPFSTPAPEKVCCGSSSSESSWRERQIGGTTGSRTFESQALESIRFLTHPAPGQRVFSFKTGPSNGVRDLTGRDSSSVAPTGAQFLGGNRPFWPFLTDAGEVTESFSVDLLFFTFANSRCWRIAFSPTASCQSTECANFPRGVCCGTVSFPQVFASVS